MCNIAVIQHDTSIAKKCLCKDTHKDCYAVYAIFACEAFFSIFYFVFLQ